MEIYKNDNYITVSHIEDKNYILYDWINLTIPLEEIKELFKKVLDYAIENNCLNFVADTSKVSTALKQEVLVWFGNEWVPKLIEAKLKSVITVLPQSSIAKLSTKSWQREITGGIIMQNVKTRKEAEDIIKEITKSSAVH